MVKRPSAEVVAMAVDSINADRLYSVRETASLINLSAEYLRDLISAGRVEAWKPLGGHFRLHSNEVKRLIRSMLTDGIIPS